MDMFYNLGEWTRNSGEDEKSNWYEQKFESHDGRFFLTITTVKMKSKSDELKSFESELKNLVENQEFEKAAVLRDKIISLKEKSKKIQDLKNELEEVIKSQEFEKAAVLRDKIKGDI